MRRSHSRRLSATLSRAQTYDGAAAFNCSDNSSMISGDDVAKALLAGVPAAISAPLALWGVYVGAKEAFRNQRRSTTMAARHQAYAAITGQRFVLSQRLVSFLQSRAHFDHARRKWGLAGYPSPSLLYDETLRWEVAGKEFATALSEALCSLMSEVGRVQTSYPSTRDLGELCQAILNYRSPVPKQPPTGLDPLSLEQWHEQAIASFGGFVEDVYGKPIRSLLDCMRAHLDDAVL